MTSHDRASNVRWLVIFSAMLMAILLYLDRFCVSMATDYIREDMKLTQDEIGWFLSAFFFSYALAQVPSGWLSDRFGARSMLAIYILTWSVFTAMIGAVHSFLMLMTARLACGLGQAGAYPTSASVVSKWVPFSERGIASAVISFGGRVGGAIAPILTAFLIVLFVPADAPLTFTDAQLLEPENLVVKLRDAKSNSPARQIFSSLPEETRDLCKGFDESQSLSPDERKQLLIGLNSLVESAGFYEEKAFQDPSLKFERKALELLKRQREGESLSAGEQERLNRFLIEGVFPREVGKLYTLGWRPVMFAYGFSGVFVAAMFWFLVRNRPELHPWCNDAERELIASGRPPGAPSPHGKPGMVPWKRLVQSRSMWLCCVMQFGTNVGWVFLVTWLPRYLADVHQVPILERGLMTSVPLVVGIVGMLGGGWLTDWMVLKWGVRWGRGLPMMLTRFSAAMGFLIVLALAMLPDGSALKSPWVFVFAFSLVAFSTDLGTAAIWAFNQDVGGRYVGSILGWGNMWGNLGAAVSPRLLQEFLGENPTIADWNTGFMVCAGAFVVSGLCGLGIDASIPIAPPDEEVEDNETSQGS